ncbi:MAG: pyrroline-5-carboxylate reductase [Verrucomicrobiota bacterium]|jgi:pyrroline-5-carboxylate reductase
MAAKLSIGFLGAGKMAAALARGVIAAGLVKPAQIRASDPSPDARSAFAKATAAVATDSNLDVVRFAQVLILAVKPVNVAGVIAEIQPAIAPGHLLMSIAAGVPLARLEAGLGLGARVIRVMPNAPALVGASATAYALGASATAEDAALAQKIFSAVGLAFQLKESLLDAVTGLSGSGPAYLFLIIEALSDGGVAAGLPREVAASLAAQTVFGSAKMVLETGLHPGSLKDMVASPGGTTIEGLHELEKGRVRGVLMSAVRAATDKSRKLGQA